MKTKLLLLLALCLCFLIGCNVEGGQVTPIPTDAPTRPVTPTMEPTAEPAAPNTPVPSLEPAPTNTPTSTPEPTATSTPTPTPEPTAINTPTPTPEPTATSTPTPTPEPTATSTPTPTPTPTPEPTATSTPTPTPKPTSTPTPKPTATPKPLPEIEYAVLDFDYGTLYVNYDLKVYSTPHAMGEYLGTIKAGTEIHATGKCTDTGWFRFDYNGKDGYVISSNNQIMYISTSKQEIEVPSGKVMVPDVSMMSAEEAKKTLEALGFKVLDIGWAYHRPGLDYPAGSIAGTSQPYGTIIKKGSEIQFSVAYAPWDWENTYAVYEASTNVKIVKRTVLERTSPNIMQYGTDYPIIARYTELVELEYSDGTILQVKFVMEDAEIESVHSINVIQFANSKESNNPFLTKDCYDTLKMDYAATYPLKTKDANNSEWLVEFDTDGSYITMQNSSIIFTDYTNYSSLKSKFTPTYWASDVAKTTVPVNTYTSGGYAYEIYSDGTEVKTLSNKSRVDVTRPDGSGYSMYYTILTNATYLKKVTFFDQNKQELDTLYYRKSQEPAIYLWYKFIGDDQIQIVNTDGTPVERFKDMLFDPAGFTNSNSSGAGFGHTKIRYFYKGDQEIHLYTYKFTVQTIDGEMIELYQNEFPLESH